MKDVQESSDLNDVTDIHFLDTQNSIRLNSCPELTAVIDRICPKWPYKSDSKGSLGGEPFLTISRVRKGFRLSSKFMTKSQNYNNAVDTVCALIVELAWATLRDNTDWLCLHCAAVQFSGRLVIFPNARRAGKSTIATLLGLQGYKVFTDDFLAVEVSKKGEIHGISSGITTRMRTPWPDSFSPEVIRNLDGSKCDFNRQYSYHYKHEAMPVQRGERCSIGAIVLLERSDENKLEMQPINAEKTLQTIILQNFSRATNSANILEVLYSLVCQVSCYELKYSNAETAIIKLEETFQNWNTIEPQLVSETYGTRDDPNIEDTETHKLKALNSNQIVEKNNGIVEYSVGDVRFLATPNGRSIFQMDEVSTGVWNALNEPTTPADIIDLFCYVFPDQDKKIIESDINKLLQELEKNEMIVRKCDSKK